MGDLLHGQRHQLAAPTTSALVRFRQGNWHTVSNYLSPSKVQTVAPGAYACRLYIDGINAGIQ